MNCPKCGAQMRGEGIASLQGEKVMVPFECPVCHYRTEQKAPGLRKPHLR